MLVPGRCGSRGQHSPARSLCYSECGCQSRDSPCQAPHCGPPRTGSPAAENFNIWLGDIGLQIHRLSCSLLVCFYEFLTCLNTLEVIAKEVSTAFRGLDAVIGGGKVDLGVGMVRERVGRIVDSKHVACSGCGIVGEADVAKTTFSRFKDIFIDDSANIL